MKTQTTARPPVYKEVGPEEMMRLRTEDGLSNREIAERCDVSTMTVRKYIGSQGFRKTYGVKREPVKREQVMSEPVPKPLLSVSEQTLIGTVAAFVLLPKQGVITIKAQTESSTVEALLSFKDAVQLVDELQEALLKMTEMGA